MENIIIPYGSDKPKLNILELFCGTKSFSKQFHDDHNVITVDIMKKYKPDILTDINSLDYKSLWKPGQFDIIWAGVPCNEFSKAKRNDLRNIDKGLALLNRTREILDYLKPKLFFIENPQSGRMKNYITDLPYYDVDYCKYGYIYRKRTRIWTNLTGWSPRVCKHDCDYSKDGRHIYKLCATSKLFLKDCEYLPIKNQKLEDRYSMPPDLIAEIKSVIIALG
jgi:hypothetical protein